MGWASSATRRRGSPIPGPVPYPAYDADLPLQKGMVLSIETTILHPRRGFIKLEDTVAVTENGCASVRRSGPRLEPMWRRLALERYPNGGN